MIQLHEIFPDLRSAFEAARDGIMFAVVVGLLIFGALLVPL